MKYIVLSLAIMLMLSGCGHFNKQETEEQTELRTEKIYDEVTESTTERKELLASKEEEESKYKKIDVILNNNNNEESNYKESNNVNDDYDEIEELIYNYCKALGQGVNSGDYSVVGEYIAKNSSLETMQKKLIPYLVEKGTREYFADADVQEISLSGDKKSAVIYVREWYDIYYSDGTADKNKEYSWKYTAVKEGGKWKLSNLE